MNGPFACKLALHFTTIRKTPDFWEWKKFWIEATVKEARQATFVLMKTQVEIWVKTNFICPRHFNGLSPPAVWENGGQRTVETLQVSACKQPISSLTFTIVFSHKKTFLFAKHEIFRTQDHRTTVAFQRNVLNLLLDLSRIHKRKYELCSFTISVFSDTISDHRSWLKIQKLWS